MSTPLFRALALALLSAAAVPAAHAVTLVNGSFEQGIDPGLFINLNAGSTAITGWTVTGTKIDYDGSYWQDSDGTRSVDLDGSWLPHASGGIAQSFATDAGTAYVVTFDMAGNPVDGPTIKPMRVSAAGQSADYFFDITGRSAANMGWVTHTWTFTATAATTTLEFRSLNPQAAAGWGPALDNVRIAAVPEPGSWALMLLGLALSGGLARRRLTTGRRG